MDYKKEINNLKKKMTRCNDTHMFNLMTVEVNTLLKCQADMEEKKRKLNKKRLDVNCYHNYDACSYDMEEESGGAFIRFKTFEEIFGEVE